MNKILRNVLISLAIIAILASIIGNIYYFGWLNLQKYFVQQGFNIAVGQIVNTVNQTGSVNLGQGLVLIKQNADPTK